MAIKNRVLAVDDNPMNLAVIEEALQHKFSLKLTASGEDALRIAPTFMPDVVLLDVMMPRPDGFEICSKFKNDPVLRHSQVFMVSAKTDISDRIRGYSAGADDYITKPFDEDELLAKVCVGLRNKTIYSSIQRDLQDLCEATGNALELVCHLRDTETGEHISRIRSYSVALAAELRSGPYADEIDDLFLDNIYQASALHDIGKIAIPDALLRKPGPLTAEEMMCMKSHSTIGERILSRLVREKEAVTFFPMAKEIARSHHESFDGTGYPDGLIGRDIPLSARIVKVVDVFDALTSKRVYKPAFSVDDAVKELVKGSGTAFDPLIVEAFLSALDEFVELHEESSEIAEVCRSIEV